MARLFDDCPGDDGIPGAQRRIAMVAIVLATVLAVLDGSMVNVALPSIGRELHIPPAMAIWIVNSYQLATAMSLVPFASLGDVIGYRRVYVAGIAGFTFTSLGCVLSSSFEWFVFWRACQGLSGAAIIGIGLAQYRHIFPSRLLVAALGFNALVVAIATSVGPTVGGAIVSFVPWQAMFLINIPLGVVACILAYKKLPSNVTNGVRFDWMGALTLAVSVGATVIFLDNIADITRHPVIAIIEGGLGLASACCFIVLQRTISAPLIPLDMFQVRRFTLAAITSSTTFIGQGAAFVALPFLFQNAYGYTPLTSAYLFTPWPVAIALVAPMAGRLTSRFSAPHVATVGLVIFTAGLALLATEPSTPSVGSIVWHSFIRLWRGVRVISKSEQCRAAR